MLRIRWNDREGYFGEQFDIAVKCIVCFFVAFFLGMFVGRGMSYQKGFDDALQIKKKVEAEQHEQTLKGVSPWEDH